ACTPFIHTHRSARRRIHTLLCTRRSIHTLLRGAHWSMHTLRSGCVHKTNTPTKSLHQSPHPHAPPAPATPPKNKQKEVKHRPRERKRDRERGCGRLLSTNFASYQSAQMVKPKSTYLADINVTRSI